MPDLSEYERRFLSMLDELRDASDVEVLYEERGPVEEEIGDATEAFELIADEEGVVLDPSLHSSFLRFEGLSSHWAVERSEVYLTGEFSVRHLAAAMLTTGVEPAVDEPTDQQRKLYSELRAFDEQPRGGAGTLSALRIDPGMSQPEVWYCHPTRGVFRMDLGYPEYLETLLVTKGTYGWQYLFTDVSMRDIDFQGAVESIQNMLLIFPDLFPGHDYDHLRARLEARL
ncbi:hypothetical protein [Streptomyces sp. NPDC057002]|uniref:hypothetical protein n=1 Tax=Streptomyces sp. NPDC057002 TaxID=3345992 RepID=UPI0036378BD8